MAGISSKAANTLQNKNKFNSGNELQSGEFGDGSGLELYDAHFRQLDPQLGRFWQVDPLAGATYNSSPFAFGNNNPILINDPFGLIGDSTDKNGNVWRGLQDVTVTSHKKQSWGGFYWPSSTSNERKQWKDNQNTIYNRTVTGQPLRLKGDSYSYNNSLSNKKRWDAAQKDYKKMSVGAVLLIASPILYATAAPGALVLALETKLTANTVGAVSDFGIQAVINGYNGKPIMDNWNPVSTLVAFGVGAPTESLGNIAGVSVINATVSSSVNLSNNARTNGQTFSFSLSSIFINALFGTAAGYHSGAFGGDFGSKAFSEGASQPINFVGAVLDDYTKPNDK